MNYFTFNRLDIIIKYLYFEKVLLNKVYDSDFYRFLYIKHILDRTGGNEPENIYNKNDFQKKSIDDYLNYSEQLFNSIQKNGFDKNQPILLGENNNIQNGSHRVACTKALNIDPTTKYISGNKINWDLKDIFNFLNKEEINEVLYRWSLFNLNNLSIIILYQPTLKYFFKLKENLQSKNIDIIYSELREFEDYSILYDIYQAETKTIYDKIQLLKQNNLKYYKICLVQHKDCVSVVDSLKEEYRQLYKNKFNVDDYICLHSPSSQKELKILLNILFSRGYYQFNEFKIKHCSDELLNWLNKLDDLLKTHNISKDDICIVGSSVMDALGLRKSTDIDIIISSALRKKFGKDITILSEWCDIVSENYSRYDITDDDIITDGSYHFYFRGFKFCIPLITYQRKKIQKRPKDVADTKLFENYYKYKLLGT